MINPVVFYPTIFRFCKARSLALIPLRDEFQAILSFNHGEGSLFLHRFDLVLDCPPLLCGKKREPIGIKFEKEFLQRFGIRVG